MESANTVFIVSLLSIALGALLKRIGVLRDQDGETLARIALNVTLPAVVLSTVPGIALDGSLALIPLIAMAECGLVLALGFALFRNQADRNKGALLTTATGYNNALFAFPIVEALWGAAGLQRLAMFDAGNAVFVLGANYLIASWYGTRAAGGTPTLTLRFVGINLLKSTPLVSYVLAIALNLAGLRFPPIVGSFLGSLAKANTPLVMLPLGIYLDLRLDRGDVRRLLAVVGLRYAAGAVAGLLCYVLLPFGEDYRTVLLIAPLLPVALTTNAYAAAFGLNRRLVSVASSVTLLVSFALMWAVATLL